MSEQQQTGAKLGKWMLIIAWISGLFLLSVVFSSWIEGRYNPNQNPYTTSGANYHEVKLEAGRHGHYIATGSINGVPVTFLIDTGASHVAIPETLKDKLNLHTGRRYTVETAAGQISVYATTLNSISLGNITLRNVEASINPSRMGHEILLGMSFLRQLELIHRGDELTLRQYY